MQFYEKAATVSTPWVKLDPVLGRIDLVGDSYPANSFYRAVAERIPGTHRATGARRT